MIQASYKKRTQSGESTEYETSSHFFLVNVTDLMYQTTTGQPLEKSSLLIPSYNEICYQLRRKVVIMSLTKLPAEV